MKKGDMVYKVYASVKMKLITEYKVTNVFEKTIRAAGESGSIKIYFKNFEQRKENIMVGSFIQFAKTMQEADILSIQLMDVALQRKHTKLKDIRKDIDKGLLTRNSAPKIRRIQ